MLFTCTTSIVHPFIVTVDVEREQLPLLIVGYPYHAVEIEKGNPPALA